MARSRGSFDFLEPFPTGIATHVVQAKEQREAREFYMAFAFRKLQVGRNSGTFRRREALELQAPGLPSCQEVAEGG